TLTEVQENAGRFLKCVIRNAKWEREEDWVLIEPTTAATVAGAPAISDLFFLRNDGPAAVVVLFSDAGGGPPLVPPRPNFTTLFSTGLPMPFWANVLLVGGSHRPVRITVHSGGDAPR